MKDLLTIDDVFAEINRYASPAVATAIRRSFELTGHVPFIALRDLNLEQIIMFRRMSST